MKKRGGNNPFYVCRLNVFQLNLVNFPHPLTKKGISSIPSGKEFVIAILSKHKKRKRKYRIIVGSRGISLT
jgi:hypothetical protein